jgi:uncharacterized protein
MRKLGFQLVLIVFGIALVTAQPLPRRPWLGARLSADPQGGITLNQVVGGTAKAAGLQAQDVLLQINGKTLQHPSEVAPTIAQYTEKQAVIFTIRRAGSQQEIKTTWVGRDRESVAKGTVTYDRVPFKGGQLSVIINKPEGTGKLPAVLFIPGYTCSSVDGLTPDHPYGRVVQAFHNAGFVVVRVEKSGLGDSQNTPDCSTTTLYDEVESFKAGFQKMKSLPYVDTEKLFIFGHSMGGIIAPAISAGEKVRGVMVYGTTAKSWFEYQLEMNRLQLKLAKLPPMEYESKCRIQADIAFDYFIRKKSLEAIAADPEKKAVLETDWQYDGKDRIFDRNQEYWRQIQDYPLLDNWKNTTGKVLVLYGESDFQAFSLPDHEQIVQTVNHYHPGNAALLSFPLTDHYFARSGTMQQAYDTFSQGKIQELFQAFNPEVTQKAVAWALALVQS